MRRVAALSALLAGSTGAIAPAAAAQEVARGTAPAGRRDVDAPVTQVAADGVYFAAGSDAGVVVGARGTLERDGRVIAEIEVRHVSATSSFAALLVVESDQRPQAGDRAVLRGLGPPGEATSRAPATGEGPGEAKPFEPLLAPAVKADSTTRGNLFHGSAGFSTSWLRDLENDREYLNLRLSTAGDVERLGGGPWSLQYRFDLDRRSGDGYDDDPQRDEWRPRVDTTLLRRHFDDGSTLGLGRFTPLALQGIGRLDGAFAEEVLGDGARIGGLVGFRPDRENYGPRTNDLVAAGWAVLAGKSSGGTRWSTSAGALASWFEGNADQHALLADASATFAGGHWLRTSAQLDAYSGSEERRSGASLTRLHASGWLRVSEPFGLRATWSHYENPDTDSLRALTPDDASYGRGRSRGALAAVETWRTGLALEQEAAAVMGDGTPTELQVTLRARDATLLDWETIGGDLALFNLVGLDQEGFGGSVGIGWQPTVDLALRLGYDATSLEIDGGDAFLSHTLSLYATRQLGATGSLWLRAARNLGDALDAVELDLGVTWRF